MKNRKALSLVSLVAVICIVVNLFSMLSFAASDSAKIFVTICDEGKIACAHEKVLVTDVDGDKALTVNDAFIITHRDLYKGEGTGYETEQSQWGLSLKKLWGVENGGSYGYYINNNMAYSLTDVLTDGDFLYAFSFEDAKNFSDKFAYFNKNTVPVNAQNVEIVLKKNVFDANWTPVPTPVEGAVITIDGVATEFKTDSNGAAIISIDDDKYHVISANVDDDLVSPPVITVRGKYTGMFYSYGSFYYLNDGVKFTGFKEIEGKKYYFGKDGKMYTGLRSITNSKGNTYTYYFGDDGVMRTGWQNIKRGNGNTYKHYFADNGIMYTGLKNITNSKGKTYTFYFGDNGCMRTGWQKIKRGNGKTYLHYFGDNGIMRTGWQKIKRGNGKTYLHYFGDNGCMRTGWQKIKRGNGKTYFHYFGDNGCMRTGWQTISKQKYYFGDNGCMRIGWQKINGKKYYFDYNGIYYSAKQIKAYVNAYNKLLDYAKLGNYNKSSKHYIYAFDSLSFGTGLKICCLEYDAESNELYASYIMNNGDYQSRNAVLIQKNVTDKMEITFAYQTIKNGKTTDINGAIASSSKRAYKDGAKIICSKCSGTKYTESDYGHLMTSQTAHILRELNDYLTKNSKVNLNDVGFYSYK